MSRRLILLAGIAFAAASPRAARAQDNARYVGTWQGALNVGLMKLRLGLTVQRDSAGMLTGSVTSIDQGNAVIPGSLAVHGDSLAITMPMANAQFRGVLSAHADSLSGVFHQGADLPLVFTRVQSFSTNTRPQEPKPPYPYQTRDVQFESVPGVRLAGTIALPEGPGPFPAVVFVTGSGPQNRDEELMGHKPFLVIADYLARHGIASLRTDDRGTASSTGNFATATSADFADDAEAALRFLRAQPKINPARVGMIGHSEGGLIAPMVAARNHDVAFIVLLAGPGIAGDSVMILQQRLVATAAGTPPAAMEANARFNRKIFAAIRAGGDSATIVARLRPAVDEFVASYTGTLSRDSVRKAVILSASQTLGPWFRYFLTYDPTVALRKTHVPVLALNGTKDLQVPYKEDLGGIEAALKAGGNRDYQTVALPGLNHLFQTANTGAISEYNEISETFSPAALQRITDWISQRFGASARMPNP